MPRAPRICPTPGCPTITTGGRCDQHRREADRARGTRTQRGYGAEHKRLRLTWARRLTRQTVNCWRCEQPIDPAQPWDLGHDDHDRTTYRGPEHQACNRATSSRRHTQ